MSEIKHTPGPWPICDNDKRIAVGVGLVDGPHGYDVAEVYNDDCDREEAWANAHLIAAAPELLEALEWIDANPNAHRENILSVVRVVIAKAKGTA